MAHSIEHFYSSGPSIVPVEQCRLPALVPVKSLVTDGSSQSGAVSGLVPVTATMPVFPVGARYIPTATGCWRVFWSL